MKAASQIDPQQEILLLHANTIFESKRNKLPPHSVKGKAYDLTELIPEKALPKHIEFVWHGINDEVNLRQFLASEVSWGECDVRLDPMGNELILRHDSFVDNPLDLDEEWLTLHQLVERMAKAGKSVKFDLKSGCNVVEKLLELIGMYDFDDTRLWFNGNVEKIQDEGFRKLARVHPNAVLQCPVDFWAPFICSAPEKAEEMIEMFGNWGMNRFSIDWKTQNMCTFFDQMDRWWRYSRRRNSPSGR